jgi:hypothetical protein
MQKYESMSLKYNGIICCMNTCYKYVFFISAVGVVGTVSSRLHKTVSTILGSLMTELD